MVTPSEYSRQALLSVVDLNKDGLLSEEEYALAMEDNQKRVLHDSVITARVKAALAATGGRGGGSPRFAQGAAPSAGHLRTIVEQLLACAVDHVVVVLGREAEAVREPWTCAI